MVQPGRLLTTSEARAIMKLSKRTFLRRVEAGEIPFARKLHEPNGAYLFEPGVIEILARQTEVKSA